MLPQGSLTFGDLRGLVCHQMKITRSVNKTTQIKHNETPLFSDDDGQEGSLSQAFDDAAQASPWNMALLDNAWASEGHRRGSNQRSKWRFFSIRMQEITSKSRCHNKLLFSSLLAKSPFLNFLLLYLPNPCGPQGARKGRFTRPGNPTCTLRINLIGLEILEVQFDLARNFLLVSCEPQRILEVLHWCYSVAPPYLLLFSARIVPWAPHGFFMPYKANN